MISIDGVTLSEDLIWDDEFETQAISQSVRHTFGVTVIQERPTQLSRVITLTAVSNGDEHSGYYTRAQIRLIEAMIGREVTLIYEDLTLIVKLLAGMIRVRPIMARPNQADADRYVGSISWIEV